MDLKGRIRPPFLRLLEKWVGKRPISLRELARNDFQRILVICPCHSLSDLLLIGPIWEAIKQNLPSVHLSVTAPGSTAPVLFNHKHIDEVICYYHSVWDWPLENVLSSWRSLRSDFDLAIVLNGGAYSQFADWIAHLSGAKYIIGPHDNRYGEFERNFFYHLTVPLPEAQLSFVEKNLAVLKYINVKTPNRTVKTHLSNEEKNHAHDFLSENFINVDKFILGIHIDNKPDGNWTAREFIDLAKHFSIRHAAKIVVTWETAAHEFGREFLNGLPFTSVQATELMVRELASVYSFCDLVVSNNLNSVLLAASVDTPAIGILENDDWQQRMPSNQTCAVVAQDSGAGVIEFDEVIEKAEALLDALPKQQTTDPFDISEKNLEDFLNMKIR